MNKTNQEIYKLFFSATDFKPAGKDYILKERGLPVDKYGRFFRTISNRSEWDNLLYLLRKHFTFKQICKSGLFAFFNFVVDNIPFIVTAFYEDEQITYLWARRIDSSDRPKNLNLKGINPPIFNIDVLFSAKPKDKIYLCEGVFDTLTLDYHGFKAIGLLGVHAYTREIINLLLPFDIEIAFDNDKAGNEAAQKLADLFWKYDKTISRTVLPIGMDINEYHKTGGFDNA